MAETEKKKNKMRSVGGLEALRDPRIREEILGDGLPNLDEIKITEMTEEERARAEAEYQRRRQFAEKAGERLAIIDREIKEIEGDQEKLELTPTLQRRLAELKAIRAQLLVEDEGVRKHTEFSALIEAIRRANPAEARKYVNEAVERGRIRPTTRSTGPNLLFWGGKVYEPVPDSTGKVTPATLGLVAELRKLIEAAKIARRNAYEEAVNALKAKGTQGLTLTRLITEEPTPAGIVYIHLPTKEEKHPETGDTKRVPESHLLVECDGKIIKPLEAVGRLEGFFAELTKSQRFVTVADLREGRISDARRLSPEALRQVVGFLKILQAARHFETQQ